MANTKRGGCVVDARIAQAVAKVNVQRPAEGRSQFGRGELDAFLEDGVIGNGEGVQSGDAVSQGDTGNCASGIGEGEEPGEG